MEPMFQEIGFRLQVLRGAQPRFPDRRIAGLLGKFPKPRGEVAQLYRVGHWSG